MQLETLLKNPDCLPAAPPVLQELVETLHLPEVQMRVVADCIGADPALTAVLIRQANASFFWRTRSIESIMDALRVLGLSKVRGLAIATVAQQSFPQVPAAELRRYWDYSMRTADLAQRFAGQARIDSGAAYTSGLLHAIGGLAMWQGMPHDMARLGRHVHPLSIKRARAEKSIFGFTYAEMGGELAQHWRFPARLVDAVGHHPQPFADEAYEPMAALVHIAAWRARGLALGLPKPELITSYPDQVGEALRLDPEFVLDCAGAPCETETETHG